MAKTIREASNADPKPANAGTKVKHLKNEQVLSLKKKMRERFGKRVLSPDHTAILEKSVTDWRAVRESRFKE